MPDSSVLQDPAEQDIIAFEAETPSVEVGGDLEAAVAEEHEIAQAEPEGSAAVRPPLAPPKRTFEQIMEAERADAIERAIVEVCDAQENASDKKGVHEDLKERASDAKKAWESADNDLRDAALRLRRLREGQNPDPKRHPLFDRTAPTTDPAKLAINEMFPAPVPIQPLPAADFAEFLRRKQRDTPIPHLGLTPAVEKVVEEDLGMKTVLDLVNKFNAVFEGGAKLTTINGITTKRLELITEALSRLTDEAQKEWDASLPAIHADAMPEPNDGDTAEFEPLTEEGDDDAEG